MKIKELISKYDSEDFLKWLKKFPRQVQSGVELGREAPELSSDFTSLVIGGMGGSAITGDLLTQFLYDQLQIPAVTVRGYQLPAWVNENTLFVGVSYSGNTEETLTMFKRAEEAGATCLSVTSNGELENRAVNQAGVIKIPGGQPPRASAPYLFLPLLFWLANLGLADAPGQAAIEEAVSELKKINGALAPENDDNTALHIARNIHRQINLVYGSHPLTSVLALRLKNQFNENAKMIALANEFPELNHNEIMGWRQLRGDDSEHAAIFLRDDSEHSRVKRRFEITAEILKENVEAIYKINSRGKSRLARFLTLMLYTDYVSYYAALLREEDPSEIQSIERLKERL